MATKTTNDELMDKINTLVTNDALKSQDIQYIKKDAEDIKQAIGDLDKKVENFYVSQDSFYPVKLFAYGAASAILLTVVIAMCSLVIIPRTTSTEGQPQRAITAAPQPAVLPTGN